MLDFKKWRPRFVEKHMKTFLEVTPKKCFNLCARNFVGKSCTKNVSGKFGEIREKILRAPKTCLLLHQSWKDTSDPIAPLLKGQRGKRSRHDSILRRPCAHYSTRALFTRCCRLQCVTVMNINYQRYPKTEQLITAKISRNALKQGSRRTHSVLRQHSSQLQKYKAARLSRRIAVDQAGMADNGHPGLTVWNL